MTKSYVTMEQHVCPVCGKHHDTGNLLIDEQMRDRFDMHTVTGYGLCPEHRKEGFLCIIVTQEEHATKSELMPHEANRSGEVIYIKREALANIFNVDLSQYEFIYMAKSGAEKIKSLMPKEDGQ